MPHYWYSVRRPVKAVESGGSDVRITFEDGSAETFNNDVLFLVEPLR
jgi:hypothetical protein